MQYFHIFRFKEALKKISLRRCLHGLVLGVPGPVRRQELGGPAAQWPIGPRHSCSMQNTFAVSTQEQKLMERFLSYSWKIELFNVFPVDLTRAAGPLAAPPGLETTTSLERPTPLLDSSACITGRRSPETISSDPRSSLDAQDFSSKFDMYLHGRRCGRSLKEESSNCVML